MGTIIVKKTYIEGLYVLEPKKYEDERGSFCEIYNTKDMIAAGLDMKFIQDNQSVSKKGVLRGLHYQKKYPQGKLVRVSYGSVYDVVVDMRKDSETFGKWFGIELNDSTNNQLYIPYGFAHGFYVLSDIAVFNYKVTDYWHPDDEIGIAWNDPTINIRWPSEIKTKLIIADKDKKIEPIKNLKG